MVTRQIYWTALLLAVFGFILPTLPTVAKYRPPSNLQLPGGRQGAATRGGCAKNEFAFAPILPASNYGETTAAYPTLYWYQANHQFTWARFELYATQSMQREEYPVYSTTFRLRNQSPLASLTLPSQLGLPPLEIGTTYLWKVTLICSQLGPEDETANGSQVSIQGWITRVEPSPSLTSQLAITDQKYDVYAEDGLWYDAIQDLAARRQEQPQNPELSRAWQDLLRETSLAPLSLSQQP
ncbi:MAG: DUF928 domain-containing protein [Thermosynechococcaceae cyanobacterium MS004]|nr:DUF928 domain-containing protein [Thermosynechococcaceae cyanobacterium MS004]